jgi:hypothetical protein
MLDVFSVNPVASVVKIYIMQENQKLPTYIITRIWFLANIIVGLAFTLITLVRIAFNFSGFPDNLFLGVIIAFLGLVISSPSLLILYFANSFYNPNKLNNTSIYRYFIYNIICINFLYFICTSIFFQTSWYTLIFYLFSTLAGILSLYLITKNKKNKAENANLR